MNKIRTRFAPSPTGFIHIGNLRTVLFGYLFTKKNNGDFIVRIEDTDQSREVEGSLEKTLEMLKWIGLVPNEGTMLDENKNIIEKGEYAPYIQSKRLDLYTKYAHELIDKGHAYYCFCTKERLDSLRDKQKEEKKAPKYDGFCKNISVEDAKERIKNGEKYVIRMKVPEKRGINFNDIIHGEIKVEAENIDDQVLIKSDGFPTYFLAVVVDDHLMNISHVFRGDDWLASAPKLVLLYEYLNWQMPIFVHVPNINNDSGKKLSKRRDSVSVEQFKNEGYLHEALINFLALLGWNPGEGSTQEIFTLDELVEKFDLSHVHKAGAVFDIKKLDWINSQWIKKLSIEELYEKALPFLQEKEFYKKASPEKKSQDYIKKVLLIEQDRLQNLSAVGESNQFFFQNINFDKELLRWKDMNDEDLKKSLEKSLAVLENITEENWISENLEKILMESAGENRGELLYPLRATLTGEKKSPSPFECAWVLGKDESLKRINNALEKIHPIK